VTRLADRSIFEQHYPQLEHVNASYLAEVVSVDDPDHMARVQVRLLNFDRATNQDAPLWARVAVPFAGDNSGAFLIPNVGDEVVVTFLNGDPRLPIVVGGLWNGAASPPETLGGDGSRVDRWTLVGRRGTRVAIVEEQSGEETIRLSTPNNASVELTETGSGKIQVEAAGTTITIDSSGVSIQTDADIQVQASNVTVNATDVTVNSPFTTFSDTVICETLIATNVVGTSYTPGVGNVW
jgi:uncharacterized protein involved in type VI secretion and phage assembly